MLNTKEILAASFEEILIKKNINDISVSEITENAKLSRSVFYHHFKDKYDLMTYIYRNSIEKITFQSELSDWKRDGIICYRFIYEHRNFFIKISKYKEQNNFLDFIFNFTYEDMSARICKEFHLDKLDTELDYSLKMYCAEVRFLIEDWINSGIRKKPEEVFHFSEVNIPKTLIKYLK